MSLVINKTTNKIATTKTVEKLVDLIKASLGVDAPQII